MRKPVPPFARPSGLGGVKGPERTWEGSSIRNLYTGQALDARQLAVGPVANNRTLLWTLAAIHGTTRFYLLAHFVWPWRKGSSSRGTRLLRWAAARSIS